MSESNVVTRCVRAIISMSVNINDVSGTSIKSHIWISTLRFSMSSACHYFPIFWRMRLNCVNVARKHPIKARKYACQQFVTIMTKETDIFMSLINYIPYFSWCILQHLSMEMELSLEEWKKKTDSIVTFARRRAIKWFTDAYMTIDDVL